MTQNDSAITRVGDHAVAEVVTRANPRMTRGLARIESALAKPEVGQLLFMLGGSSRDGFVADSPGSEGWLVARDVSVSPEGRHFLVFPHLFGEHGEWLDYLPALPDSHLGGIPQEPLYHVATSDGWLIAADNISDLGEALNQAFYPIGYALYSMDFAGEYEFIRIYEDDFGVTRELTHLVGVGGGCMCLFDNLLFCVTTDQVNLGFGLTWHQYKYAAVAGDTVYAIPDADLRSIHQFPVETLIASACSVHEAFADESDRLDADAVIHASGNVLDCSGQGNLLLTLEVRNCQFRIASYDRQGLVGAFEPRLNGVPVIPTHLDASADKIILGVPPKQGGALVYQGGSREDWERLRPSDWPDPDAEMLTQIQSQWDAIRHVVKQSDRKAEDLLTSCTPTRVFGSDVLLSSPYKFHASKLNEARHREVIEDSIEIVCGTRLQVWARLEGTEDEWPNCIGRSQISAEALEAGWPRIFDEIHAVSEEAAAYLDEFAPLKLSGRIIRVFVPAEDYQADEVDSLSIKHVVQQAILRVLNSKVRVEVWLGEPFDDDSDDDYDFDDVPY